MIVVVAGTAAGQRFETFLHLLAQDSSRVFAPCAAPL
jgi:hypothetical protein